MTNWLQQAQYRLKLHDHLTELLNLQGIGQGTGWLPPSWSSLSDLITCTMNKNTPDIKLVHPNSFNNHRTIDTFIENTNGCFTQEAYESFQPHPQTLVQKQPTIFLQTQSNIQFYSNLLQTTGGKLSLHKCSIYVFQTTWKNGKHQYASTHNTTQPIPIDQHTQTQSIKIISPQQSRKILGIYTAPNRNMQVQATVLRDNAEKWRNLLKLQSLYQYEVLLSYHHRIMKSLEYPVGDGLL